MYLLCFCAVLLIGTLCFFRVVEASLGKDEVSMPPSLMTLKALSGVINISLIGRINYRCAKCRDLKCHSPVVCLPPTRLLQSSPLAGTSYTLLFFSVPQHQNSLLAHAHMHPEGTDNHQTCVRARARKPYISCESSLIELTLQLTGRFTAFRSKSED